MRSVWDDNMGIHYSLELEASCRSMLEPIKSQTLGTFALTRPGGRAQRAPGKQPVADLAYSLASPSIIWLC